MRKMWPFLTILLFSILILSCGRKTENAGKLSRSPQENGSSVQQKKISIIPFEYALVAKALNSYYMSLSEMERVSQVFLVNINGNEEYSPVEFSGNEPLVPGGYLFFTYNVAESPETILSFIQQIEKYCIENNVVPPYLSVDQEGGPVNRFRKITSPLPSNCEVAKNMTPKAAFLLYRYQAQQLNQLGFHMNLAPVAEPLNKSNESLLEDRSYGGVGQAEKYSSLCISAYQQQNVSCVAKHFPGNSSTDPHTGLPFINVSQKELEEQYLAPFKKVLVSNPDAVLMSHAVVSTVDKNGVDESGAQKKEMPACLSRYWVTEKLKNELNYNGLIISDDIYMGALIKNGWSPEEASVLAINAGVDVIMLTQKQYGPQAKEIIRLSHENPEFHKNLVRAEKKVLAYKHQKGILTIEETDSGNLQVVAVASRKTSHDYDRESFLNILLFNNAKEKGTEIYSKYFQEK